MSFIYDVNEQNINQIIQNSVNTPVVFYFWTSEQADCIPLGELLTKIANEKNGQFILAKLDCKAERMLAAQFRVNQLPTTYLFLQGQPVDGFQGNKPENEIREFLEPHLPNEHEQMLAEATTLFEEQKYSESLPLLNQCLVSLRDHFGHQRSDIAFMVIKSSLALKQLDDAKKLLSSIPIQDQDSTYQSLLAESDILEQAGNSPELKHIQAEFSADPNNSELRIKLALQLTQAGKHQDAIELLFEPLKTDLNASDGEIKKSLMELLAALGVNHSLATEYRRKLYTLLY